MKKLDISIPTPCQEKWTNMQANEAGRYCLVCQKTVIDFTQKSEKEIATILLQSEGKVCGRFLETQLKPIYLPEPQVSNRNLKTYFFVLANAVLASWFVPTQTQGQAQVEVGAKEKEVEKSKGSREQKTNFSEELIVKGYVRDMDTKEALAGVAVVLKGTYQGVGTDANGNFKLTIIEGQENILVFSFVGYIKQEIKIEKQFAQKSKNREIIVNVALQEDTCALTGEIVVVAVEDNRPLYKVVYQKIKKWLKL